MRLDLVQFFLRGNKRERTRMRKFEDEPLFAFQIATNAIDEGIRAAHMAHDAQAAFIDLNTGCPIYGCALPPSCHLRQIGRNHEFKSYLSLVPI